MMKIVRMETKLRTMDAQINVNSHMVMLEDRHDRSLPTFISDFNP